MQNLNKFKIHNKCVDNSQNSAWLLWNNQTPRNLFCLKSYGTNFSTNPLVYASLYFENC